ncbi:MAG: hypothetical protein Ta2A_13520 [Treponemataceae bacterium]|nr:MAG: hypothetical protein Ta2A_13520 [Treponemataceae bacterium]
MCKEELGTVLTERFGDDDARAADFLSGFIFATTQATKLIENMRDSGLDEREIIGVPEK